jgi:hypothetical protein
MRLESGPAKAERNWQFARAAVFLVLVVWLVYDGGWGYPGRNQAEAEKRLAAPEPFGGKVKFESVGDTPRQNEFEAVQKVNPSAREEVRSKLGAPTLTVGGVGGARTGYYITRWGYGAVACTGERVTGLSWTNWGKTEEETHGQFYWAAIFALPGLYFLSKMAKAMMLRVVVDDEGMVYGGQRIQFGNMVSLRDYSPKGWIDLYHRVGPQERKLRLDNEKVALFDEVVDAVCQAKGFKNEVRAYAEEKAQQQAEEAAAKAAEEAADGSEQRP